MDGDRYDVIVREYGPKMKALAERIARGLTDAGHTVDEPWENYCDTYSWDMMVYADGDKDRDAREGDIDIRLELVDAGDYGDEEDGKPAVNFRLDIVEWGGRMIGNLTPYNYTEQCWVLADDKEALEERWRLFEDGCDPDGVVAVIAEDLARQKVE